MINVAKDDAGCHVDFLNRAASRVDYHTQQSILTTMTMQTTAVDDDSTAYDDDD
jgi:hypothetical protein